jgi:hypothetical protein
MWKKLVLHLIVIVGGVAATLQQSDKPLTTGNLAPLVIAASVNAMIQSPIKPK